MKKFFVLAVLLFSVSAFADPAVLGRFECFKTDGTLTTVPLQFEKTQYSLDVYFIKSVVNTRSEGLVLMPQKQFSNFVGAFGKFLEWCKVAEETGAVLDKDIPKEFEFMYAFKLTWAPVVHGTMKYKATTIDGVRYLQIYESSADEYYLDNLLFTEAQAQTMYDFMTSEKCDYKYLKKNWKKLIEEDPFK